MLFADNVVLMRKLLKELSAELEALTKEGKGLRVSKKKTEFMIFKFSGKHKEDARITGNLESI